MLHDNDNMNGGYKMKLTRDSVLKRLDADKKEIEKLYVHFNSLDEHNFDSKIDTVEAIANKIGQMEIWDVVLDLLENDNTTGGIR